MTTEPETKPKRRSYPPRRFASPRGGDADPQGAHVVQYYNPSPGVVAKKHRMKQVAARLFAERGLAAVGLNQVSQAANLPPGTAKYYYRNRDDMLTEILYDHVVVLTERVGAAHDATADVDAATRLTALVRAFHEGVQAAADAHRALLYSVTLLPAEAQRSVKGRYGALLEIFVETLRQVAPRVAPELVPTRLLPVLERLLSGVVFWGCADADAVDPQYPGMVTTLVMAAAYELTTRGRTVDEGTGRTSGFGAGLLAGLSRAVEPGKSGRSLVGRCDESSIRRSRRPAGAAEPNWLPLKEAKRDFDAVLCAAAAGKEFVIASHGWPVARLGPPGVSGGADAGAPPCVAGEAPGTAVIAHEAEPTEALPV